MGKGLTEFLSKGEDESPQYDPAELKRGIEVEKEHADLYKHLKSLYPDFRMSLDEFAEWIAKAHLREIKDYYTRLDRMEKEAGEGE